MEASIRQIVRQRLLQEVLLNKPNPTTPATAAHQATGPHAKQQDIAHVPPKTADQQHALRWKALILDPFTSKIFRSICTDSEINEAGASVVEQLHSPREAVALPAVYFIQHTPDNVDRLLQDFSRKPLYQRAYIFFSCGVSMDTIARIKACPLLFKCLAGLKQVNVEYLLVDSRTVVTDQPQALARLMGERADGESQREQAALVQRVAAVVATLGEFPSIRFQRRKDEEGTNTRALVTQQVAAKLHAALAELQHSKGLPGKQTCDLLVLDRSVDPVAPLIHDFSYGCLAHDLLPLEQGSVFKYKADTGVGLVEKHAVIDDTDEVFVELRHEFFAQATTRIMQKADEFRNSKMAMLSAQVGSSSLSNSDMGTIIRSLPQYTKLKEKVLLHVDMVNAIHKAMEQRGLQDIGILEQNLVYGDQGGKELLEYLREAGAGVGEVGDRLRLLLCYLASWPDRLPEASQLLQAAGLDQAEAAAAVRNLTYLGVNASKTGQQGRRFKLKSFLGLMPNKAAQGMRRTRELEDGDFLLKRFEPVLYDIIEDISKRSLSAEEYPYIVQPEGSNAYSRTTSVYSPGMPSTDWGRKDNGGGSGLSAGSSSGALNAGRRLVIVMVGGVSRSEMRVAHQLSKAHHRDIVLVSTSVDTPSEFIHKLSHLHERSSDGPATLRMGMHNLRLSADGGAAAPRHSNDSNSHTRPPQPRYSNGGAHVQPGYQNNTPHGHAQPPPLARPSNEPYNGRAPQPAQPSSYHGDFGGARQQPPQHLQSNDAPRASLPAQNDFYSRAHPPQPSNPRPLARPSAERVSLAQIGKTRGSRASTSTSSDDTPWGPAAPAPAPAPPMHPPFGTAAQTPLTSSSATTTAYPALAWGAPPAAAAPAAAPPAAAAGPPPAGLVWGGPALSAAPGMGFNWGGTAVSSAAGNAAGNAAGSAAGNAAGRAAGNAPALWGAPARPLARTSGAGGGGGGGGANPW